MAKIDAFFKLMKEQGASDLHMAVGAQPMLRLRGELTKVNFRELSQEDMQGFIYEIMTPAQKKEFDDTHDIDFAYEVPDVARFRANVMLQRKGMTAVFRMIPTKILTCEDLGLPEAVKKFAHLKKGLVLVTGATGSGKSTTLAAIIDHVNDSRHDHILTVEDPLEFVHPNKSCLVNQREVGGHTASFSRALKAALREDPDVILIGEMRDLETISLAITAAETGHLVFGTLHTSSAAKTVDRIIDAFPTNQQEQIRTMLAESLRGVVAQQLLRTADGKGRCAALEILVGTTALANLIREGKTFQIPSIIQTGKREGMQTMDQAIMDLLKIKKITPQEAYNFAVDKKLFEQYLSAGAAA
ncbi:MAG: type IV pilus twitching motility protein PilT [Nitrospirota bacterium]|nr:type IV pilus twitching motility protein PilT [Nitrospirota bacterium]